MSAIIQASYCCRDQPPVEAHGRIPPASGMAIGPILFVIAILAILAMAIAAGSNMFAVTAGEEANRTHAASIIQIGQGLRSGMTRIVALGAAAASVDVNTQNTTGNLALFSSQGGGLVAPSTMLAASPGSDAWIFTWGPVTNVGGPSLERLALLKVSQGLCDQVNLLLGIGATATGDIGALDNTTNMSAWSAGLNVAYGGRLAGCIDNSNAVTPGYYFYQVLSEQ